MAKIVTYRKMPTYDVARLCDRIEDLTEELASIIQKDDEEFALGEICDDIKAILDRNRLYCDDDKDLDIYLD